MKTWKINRILACPEALRLFKSLDDTFSLAGEIVKKGDLSDLMLVRTSKQTYYVKRYYKAGRRLRRLIGTSRLRGEWKNLQRFAAWGIQSAPLIGHGRERTCLIFQRGALITKELEETTDLAKTARIDSDFFRNREQVETVSRKVAAYTRAMHDHGFIHGDLKWRNILIRRNQPEHVYLIDCPSGSFWIWPFLQYRKNKDLACLDKAARTVLSRTQRLRFFLYYLEKERLDKKSKKQIRKIIRFFDGED
jgi:tRNA A-37 threonylcarbamoyl transferase component Bud32